MKFSELTIKDMDGIEIKGKTVLDVLAATAERANQILETHEAAQRQTTNMPRIIYPERKTESSVRIANGEGEGSFAAAPTAKRKKCNALNNNKNIPGNGPQPPSPLPQDFKNVIQEMGQGKNISQETLVIQKRLFETDMSKYHNRLSIPISQISDEFLTEEEKNYLGTHDKNNKKNYIEVRIIEPSLEREIVKFCKWDMAKNNGKTSSCYVMNGKWKPIVDRNELRVGMIVQVWCYRIEEELCFALVRLPKNPTENTS